MEKEPEKRSITRPSAMVALPRSSLQMQLVDCSRGLSFRGLFCRSKLGIVGGGGSELGSGLWCLGLRCPDQAAAGSPQESSLDVAVLGLTLWLNT